MKKLFFSFVFLFPFLLLLLLLPSSVNKRKKKPSFQKKKNLQFIMASRFEKENTREKRCMLSNKIRTQHEDRIPVIVEKKEGARIGDIEKTKFLAPESISVAQFKTQIRKHIVLNQNEALFLFVDGKSPTQCNFFFFFFFFLLLSFSPFLFLFSFSHFFFSLSFS